MGKKSRSGSGSGSGMNIPDHIFESLEEFFGFKINKFFGIRNLFVPGSGIRDKHPVSGINIPDPQH
jgi:hypothetical protein